MADGGMTLQIDESLAERLRIAAEIAGKSVEDFATEALAASTEAGGDWAEDMDRLAEFERTGVSHPIEPFLDDLRAYAENRKTGG
jgi:hypothetical protein